jgi:hypothetical protein
MSHLLAVNGHPESRSNLNDRGGVAAEPEANRQTGRGVSPYWCCAVDDIWQFSRQPFASHLEWGPALRELGSRAPLRVEVAATGERFAPALETTADFVVWMRCVWRAPLHAPQNGPSENPF